MNFRLRLRLQAKGAGATIRLGTECTSVTRSSTGTFHAATRATNGGDENEHEFDIFVNAAGLWSRDFSENVMGMQFVRRFRLAL